MPTSGDSEMSEQMQYVIRVEGMHNSFGLGEIIIPGVTLFRAGEGWKNYNLTADELEAAIKKNKAFKVRS